MTVDVNVQWFGRRISVVIHKAFVVSNMAAHVTSSCTVMYDTCTYSHDNVVGFFILHRLTVTVLYVLFR